MKLKENFSQLWAPGLPLRSTASLLCPYLPRFPAPKFDLGKAAQDWETLECKWSFLTVVGCLCPHQNQAFEFSRLETKLESLCCYLQSLGKTGSRHKLAWCSLCLSQLPSDWQSPSEDRPCWNVCEQPPSKFSSALLRARYCSVWGGRNLEPYLSPLADRTPPGGGQGQSCKKWPIELFFFLL